MTLELGSRKQPALGYAGISLPFFLRGAAIFSSSVYMVDMNKTLLNILIQTNKLNLFENRDQTVIF
jgi:hypothetical protein